MFFPPEPRTRSVNIVRPTCTSRQLSQSIKATNCIGLFLRNYLAQFVREACALSSIVPAVRVLASSFRHAAAGCEGPRMPTCMAVGSICAKSLQVETEHPAHSVPERRP